MHCIVVRDRDAVRTFFFGGGGIGIATPVVRRCPYCGGPSPPIALLFDEDYDSHSFYDFERIEEWFAEADAVVFVGTSFAVTLTC